MSLQSQLKLAFPDHGIPAEHELVDWDGYDEMDKHYAVTLLLGQSREHVGAMIRTSRISSEELVALTPTAFLYYVEPFLRYVVECELPSSEENDVALSLFWHISEAIRLNGQEIFSERQASLLVALGTTLLGRNPRRASWGAFPTEDLERLIAVLSR